jgi:RNA polymerase sigma factor (sigma-70 family)
MSTDTDLVRRCLDGDRLGWADLLARYGDLIYGLFHRAGLDKTSAADGFQEVSILLWKSLKKLRRAESLVPWIATTTKRIAWRMKQRSRSRADRDASVARPEADTGGGPDDTVARLEEEQRVREALATLGERCRRLLGATSTGRGYDDRGALASPAISGRRAAVPRGCGTRPGIPAGDRSACRRSQGERGLPGMYRGGAGGPRNPRELSWPRNRGAACSRHEPVAAALSTSRTAGTRAAACTLAACPAPSAARATLEAPTPRRRHRRVAPA